MRQYILPALSIIFALVIFEIAYSRMEVTANPGILTCTGECYEAYVAVNGNIVEQQREAAAAAAVASPAELGELAYTPCQACHGLTGQGGVGPSLVDQEPAFIEEALTAYKNRETRGPQSALMWPTAAALSATDIENLAAFIETL